MPAIHYGRMRACVRVPLCVHRVHDLWYRRIGPEVRKLGPARRQPFFSAFSVQAASPLKVPISRLRGEWFGCVGGCRAQSAVRNTWELSDGAGAQAWPGGLDLGSLGRGTLASSFFVFFLPSFCELPEVTPLCSQT